MLIVMLANHAGFSYSVDIFLIRIADDFENTVQWDN